MTTLAVPARSSFVAACLAVLKDDPHSSCLRSCAETFHDRLLHPHRTFARFLEDHAGRLDSPAETWETLAVRGVVPTTWVQDERRWFVGECLACSGRGAYATSGASPATCQYCDGTGAVDARHPATLTDCLAIASDVPAVLRTEALARELSGRDEFTWRVLPREEAVKLVSSTRLPPEIFDAIERTQAEYWRRIAADAENSDAAAAWTATADRAASCLRDMLDAGIVIGCDGTDGVTLATQAIE